jgi:hypothetical protein
MPLTFLVAVLGLTAVPSPDFPAQHDSSPAPMLVVRVSSIDDAIADLKYLAGLAGQPGDVKKIDAQVKKVFPKGFPGIDTKRPLGLYGTLDPAGNARESMGTLLVPVNDEKAFLALLQDYELKAQKADDGTYTLERGEDKIPVYLRFAHKYAYINFQDRAALATDQLLPPARIFSGDSAETVAASFRIEKIPDVWRKVALPQVEGRLAAAEEQRPAGETETQHALRVQVLREAARKFTALLTEGSDLTLRLKVNRQTHELTAEASLSGKPDSELAKNLAALGGTPSLFGNLAGADSAISGLIHFALPAEVRKALVPVIDDGIRATLLKEKDKAKRALAEKVLNSLAPTLKAGELDAAVDLRRGSGNKHYRLVAGVKVQDGAAIDQALRELLKELPGEQRGRIKIDAETAGDVKIHRIDVQKDLDEHARKNFGDNPFYVAVRSDALFIAGGDNGLAALKEALVAKPATAPLLRFDVSLARLASVMGKKKVDPQEAAHKIFSGDDKDNDKIHLTVEGGKTLKIRLDLKTPVIKFMRLIDPQGPAS